MKIKEYIWCKTVKTKRAGEQMTVDQRGEQTFGVGGGTTLAECRMLGFNAQIGGYKQEKFIFSLYLSLHQSSGPGWARYLR